MQLVVLGMHRSGTSGVTRLLNMAGAYFGPPEAATAANAENPKGFWERRDVRDVCDGLLHGSGFDWHHLVGFGLDHIPASVAEAGRAAFSEILEELDAHRPWVVKEPRLCLLLPVVRPLLTSPVCVHVTREPLEVAQSVHRRNDIPVQGALALWELYTLYAAEVSRDLPSVHVRHEDLIVDPVSTLARLLEDLEAIGVSGLSMPPDRDVVEFISPDLHRNRRSSDLRGGRLSEQQATLASRADDGTLFAPDAVLPPLSEGALEELHVVEQLHRAQRSIEELQRDVRTEQAETERIRRTTGRVVEEALDALDRTEQQVRAMVAGKPAKLAAYLVAMRRTITPGLDRRDPTPFSDALANIERGRRRVRGVATEVDQGHHTVESEQADPRRLIVRSRPEPPPTDRKTVAVIAWDVGHNPLGRANVLAEVLQRRFDVEMWGAQFDRYGARVWAPLRDGAVAVNSFPGRPFPQHQAVMEVVAEAIDADAIWVSKPRLPSFLLGALAKERHGSPLVLDVDDHELAFFAEDEGLDITRLSDVDRADPELRWPFERTWTRACDPLIGFADQTTVSNRELQERYGGLIVPHARDETLFDPDRVDREEARARLGVRPDDKLLIFGGTPRLHKGIVEILRALEEIDDPKMRLLVFGTREFDELRPHIGSLERWVTAVPYLPFRELPEVIAAADLSCILQDPDHPVSRYQMPAKVTDALAMGVPCLVRPTPPLRALVDDDVVGAVRPGESLAEAIRSVFERRDEALERAERGRKTFLASYSYEAVARTVVPVFEQLMAERPPMDPRLRPIIEVPRHLYGGSSTGTTSLLPPERTTSTRASGPHRRFAPGDHFDLVVFWKQNDTGIYGRRQDKVLEHLLASGRVGTVVHFDNPLSPEALVRTWRKGRSSADQGGLVARQTVRRLSDARRRSGTVHHHTFLHAGSRTARLGLPGRHLYTRYVLRTLADHGVGRDRPVVLWGYPTNTDLPVLIDSLDPDLVVSDVVDDNRTWFVPGTPEHDRTDINYEQVLRRSDVVFANCDPVATSMARFAEHITVVPNGLDLPAPDASRGPRPKELQRFEGPVIGYVGNLSSRLDLDLVAGLTAARPDWQFVFIGSAHLDRSILDLRHRSNVHFLGVMPHHVAQRYLAHFDVAIIPHLDNEMTRAMNPLKAFVYAAAGVPVVSTPIANLGDLGSAITIAHGADGFEAAIEDHLTSPPEPLGTEVLGPHSWEQRVATMLAAIDTELARRGDPGHDG